MPFKIERDASEMGHSQQAYGTRAVEAGIDVFSVAKVMGHADLKTTERYVHLSKAHLEDAQKRIERFRAGQRSR